MFNLYVDIFHFRFNLILKLSLLGKKYKNNNYGNTIINSATY